MSATSIVLLALLAQAASPSVGAQDKAKAKSLLSEGSAIYKKGDYAGALEKFEAAYAAYPSPKLWFNIGQVSRDLGRPVEALDAFEKFLALAPDASPDTLEDARSSVAELQKKLGQVRIECETAGAEIRADGKSVGRAPLAKPLWLTPGRHQVTGTAAGVAPAMEDVEISAGSMKSAVIRLVPIQAAVAAPTSPSQPPAQEVPLPTPLLTPTPTAASPAALDLTSKPESTPLDRPNEARPFYKTWWFWTGAVAVVAAGTVTAILIAGRSSSPCDGASLACRGVK
jgi:hypothetical protein